MLLKDGDKMQGKSLALELTNIDFHKLLQRYHFTESGYETVKYLYFAVEPLVKAEVFIEYNPGYEWIEYSQYVVVAVTLGDYMDQLIALYTKAEKVSQAYMVDCIGLELLMQAYYKVSNVVHSETKLWMQQMEFLGDKYAIDTIPEILQHMKQTHITCNDAFMLLPQKSAVFVAELTEEYVAVDKNCNLCENCKSMLCPNRIESKEKMHIVGKESLNYGYQRIFGKKENT